MSVDGLTDLQRWNKLAQGNEEKVQVEEEFELLVKDEREKADDTIFLVSYHVGRKP